MTHKILSLLTMRELCNVQQVSQFWYCAGKENEVYYYLHTLSPLPPLTLLVSTFLTPITHSTQTRLGLETNTTARLNDMGSK